MGQTEAAQRGGKSSGQVRGRKGGLLAKSRENHMKTREFGGLSWLDDIRGLRIQASLRSRWLKRTARTKRHRVFFQRLSRHRALQIPTDRPVIHGRPLSRVGERIVVVPKRLVLFTRARHEVRNASELRMAATQSDQTRSSEETTTEQDRAFRNHSAHQNAFSNKQLGSYTETRNRE